VALFLFPALFTAIGQAVVPVGGERRFQLKAAAQIAKF
jgi:hypothetical protein